MAKNIYGKFDFDLSFQKGVNVIIGDNDTGKTTIIEILRAVQYHIALYSSDHEIARLRFDRLALSFSNGQTIEYRKKSDLFNKHNPIRNDDILLVDRLQEKISNVFQSVGSNKRFHNYPDKKLLSGGHESLYDTANRAIRCKDVLLLDCPEYGLDVSTQYELLPALEKISNQLIITTHSPILINRVDKERIIRL